MHWVNFNCSSIKISCKGIDESFIIIIKNDYRYEYFDFKGIGTIIFDGRRKVSKIRSSIEMDKPGVYIIMKGRQ